tara:strand:- start:785 stop:1027 length:243 start_codon:yes stop_codon:yes gene_type:complete
MAKKIKKDELAKLQELVKNYNQHQLKLGELEVEKHGLLHSISNVQQDLQEFQNELKETYGEVSIDINDGKIAQNESSKED